MTEPHTEGHERDVRIVPTGSFAPDERTRGLLAEPVAVGNPTARSLVFLPREFNARTNLYCYATGDSQAMCMRLAGIGSQYLWEITGDDGTTTIHFSPERPDGVAEGNWIQTVPGKGWNVILRLYSPLPSFFDQSWPPGEITRA